jgi:hypothetical protein
MRRSGVASVETVPEETLVRVAPRVSEPVVIEHAVAKLREIERRTGLERTLAIGSLVLETFFGGDECLWRNRRRNKNNSIRRLASHPDCPFCKSALNDAIGVYVRRWHAPLCPHVWTHHLEPRHRSPETPRERARERAPRGGNRALERSSVVRARHHGAKGRRRAARPTDGERGSPGGVGAPRGDERARRFHSAHSHRRGTRCTNAARVDAARGPNHVAPGRHYPAPRGGATAGIASRAARR